MTAPKTGRFTSEATEWPAAERLNGTSHGTVLTTSSYPDFIVG
jgi:hypothetical protein